MRDDKEAPYAHVEDDDDYLWLQDAEPETDLNGALAVIGALIFVVGVVAYVLTR